MKHVLTSPAVRFWAKVDKDGPTPAHRPELGPCWLWLGGKAHDGYGRFRRGRKTEGMVQAHRWALEDSLGRPLAAGMRGCHHCDNPSCVRPSHLFEGTHMDNERDKDAKGRRPAGATHGMRLHPEFVRRGSANSRAKITEDQVRSVRLRVAAGESQAAVARSLGVTPTIVCRILKGRIWKHVA